MRRLSLVSGVLLAAVLLWSVARRHLPSHIEYRGEQIKLTKLYLDHDDYKTDPDNVDPSENSRVERLVLTAPIASSFPDRLTMAKAVFAIRFPGYGLSSFAESALTDGTTLAGFSVEIPRAGKDRVFVFRSGLGGYSLLDDFVAPNEPAIMRVTHHGDRLVYSTMQGREFLNARCRGDEGGAAEQGAEADGALL